MHETKRIRLTRTLRNPDVSRPEALTAAATSPTGTVSTVMDELPPGTGSADVTNEEKKILQGIAHGGEGYGNEYGAGPGAANADPLNHLSPAIPGDSSSPAASAMTTSRKTLRDGEFRKSRRG
jgi:hypothetical protein